jgi:hypothetical protein
MNCRRKMSQSDYEEENQMKNSPFALNYSIHMYEVQYV